MLLVKGPRKEVSSQINLLHEHRAGQSKGKGLGSGWYLGGKERNFMSLKMEARWGQDTLPSNSSHPSNTRTITRSTPNDPSLNHQPANFTFQLDLRTKEVQMWQNWWWNWNAGRGNYSEEAKTSWPLLAWGEICSRLAHLKTELQMLGPEFNNASRMPPSSLFW